MPTSLSPYTLVLGIAQDGGYPQAGDRTSPAWENRALRRFTTCLALIDPATSRRWLFDSTPDFKEQLHRLDGLAPREDAPGLDGIFLTHAHIGHYTGLIHLGIEALNASAIPTHAMPRMAEFLHGNGPWNQLIEMGNLEIKSLQDRIPVHLDENLSVTPLTVPHRDEYSETVGFRIAGPERSVLFLPDITGWDAWAACGTRIDDALREVDIAYLDGTFMSGDELPGRDLSTIKHPMIDASIARFSDLPDSDRCKVRFIHLNQSNPLIRGDAAALDVVTRSGCGVAHEGEIVRL